jgi:hypothetical protein
MHALISRFYHEIYKIWRPRRIKLFIELIQPKPEETLLDVGGCPGFWKDVNIQVARIDTLNLQHQEEPPESHKPRIRSLVGDGCNLPFANQEYPIAFSNSVIEHVGDFEAQSKFAREIRRTGQRIWVQTPAYAFPIEPHALMPFVHWFPWKIRKMLIKLSPVALMWKGEVSDFYGIMKETRLLKKSEMQSLFPDCTILTEKFLGFSKSYIAYRDGFTAERNSAPAATESPRSSV